jgi:hypothetical protein
MQKNKVFCGVMTVIISIISIFSFSQRNLLAPMAKTMVAQLGPQRYYVGNREITRSQAMRTRRPSITRPLVAKSKYA